MENVIGYYGVNCANDLIIAAVEIKQTQVPNTLDS